jgi:hypothetical protein
MRKSRCRRTNNTTLQRIRAEYVRNASRLTLEQAQRLCGVERALCKMVLDAVRIGVHRESLAES